MFCINCGKEIGESKYCPFCGHSQEGGAPEMLDGPGSYVPDPSEGTTYRFRGDGVAEIYRGVFRDPMFLAICVLMTASAALSFVIGSSESGKVTFSVGILEILYVIALWLIFAAARNESRFSGTGLAIASGVVKATFIITCVVAGIILVCGVLIAVFGPLAIDSIDLDFTHSAAAVQASLISPGPGSSGGSGSIPLPEGFDWLDGLDGLDKLPYISSISIRVIGIIMIVAAVVVILVNIFFIRNLHKFTKSLCTSLKSDTYNIQKANTSRIWLMVSAVFSIIGFVSSIYIAGVKNASGVMSAAGQLCSILSAILASVLIKRYFVDEG